MNTTLDATFSCLLRFTEQSLNSMVMRIIMVSLSAVLIATSASANSISIPFGPENIAEPGFNGGNSLSVTLNVPTTTKTLTEISLTLEGDLDGMAENFVLSLDGISLGTILNNDSSDDLLGFSGGTDVGSTSPLSSTDTLSIDASTIAADGSIVLIFATSSGVDAPAAVNTPTVFPGLTGQFAVFGTLTFTTVPEPNALALLLFGSMSYVGLWRKHRFTN